MSNVHTFTEKTGLIDEQDIREWFKTVDIEQARDTSRVVEGILEMRAVPKRKKRADAGRKRAPELPPMQQSIDEMVAERKERP